MKNFLSILFVGIICSGCTNSTTEGIPVVQGFQSARYAGKWYEIARMPNWFERGMNNVTAVYSVNPDGTFKVVNTGVRGKKRHSVTGKAWFVSRPDIGELKVSFCFPFSSPYRIIYLDNDYSAAVVTGGNYAQLWILSRTPVMPPDELEKLLQWITALGYETEKLIFPGQNQYRFCK